MMERDSAETNSIQKKYATASVVNMREQRPPSIFRKLCGFAGWRRLGENGGGIPGLPLGSKKWLSEHSPHYPREGQKPIWQMQLLCGEYFTVRNAKRL